MANRSGNGLSASVSWREGDSNESTSSPIRRAVRAPRQDSNLQPMD
jgi:hypothetical protein